MKKDNGETKPTPSPFVIQRTGVTGIVEAYMQITERVINGEVEAKQAHEGTRALGGISTILNTQIQAMKLMDKGSTQKIREAAAGLLQLSAPIPEKEPDAT